MNPIEKAIHAEGVEGGLDYLRTLLRRDISAIEKKLSDTNDQYRGDYRFLLSNERNINLVQPHGTYLYLALREGKYKAANVLLDEGINPTLCDSDELSAIALAKSIPDANSVYRSILTVTNLHRAAAKNDVALMEQMIGNGVPADEFSDKGETALHVAAYYQHVEVCEFLLNQKPELANIPTKNGASVLFLVLIRPTYDSEEAQKTLLAIINVLLKFKANPNVPCRTGETTLHLAAEKNLYLVIKRFIMPNGNPNAVCEKGCTPLIQLSD